MKIKNTLVLLSLAAAAFASHAGRIVTLDIAYNARDLQIYPSPSTAGTASVVFDVDSGITYTKNINGSIAEYNGTTIQTTLTDILPQYVRDELGRNLSGLSDNC